MTMFKMSKEQHLELAKDVVRHLRETLRRQESRKDWTKGNLDALRGFKHKDFPDIQVFPGEPTEPKDKRAGEFLYDYVAYVQKKGILIAAESEWENRDVRIREDFEKLLYVRSPVKVMMYRHDHKRSASVIADNLSDWSWEACRYFSSAEVFILYCVREPEGDSRYDEAFYWQVPGDPSEECTERFNFQPLDIAN
jgi:hypothetical protein